MNIEKISEYKFRIRKSGNMKTDGIIIADDHIIDAVKKDKAYVQVANVATLAGIYGNALAMPDIHYGYGFPIGGVAAFEADGGIISPGGIGYDINCGVRVASMNITIEDIEREDISRLIREFYNKVPSGVGRKGEIVLSKKELAGVLQSGAQWAVKNGHGSEDDLLYTEENGCMEGAETAGVSERAHERGRQQLGTLGAGNHFIEIQKVSEIFDNEAAAAFGLRKGLITVMIHTGSRGIGYQICDDYLKVMHRASERYKIELEDRQLACAPISSDEGRRYYGAMKCGANYAWANRQCIMHNIRKVCEKVLGNNTKIKLIYDVCHNIGKIEEHNGKQLVVHRKGATRSFGPGRPQIPEKYRSIGQPVIVPGTMGTASYIMKGTSKAMHETFGSTCHGAGRVWSRTKALKSLNASDIISSLADKGIEIIAKSYKTVAEEAPQAYKDVTRVVDICHNAGISSKVAKLEPLGVIKG